MEKEKLRYSIIVDGHDNEEYALLEDARCFALTETLNAKEQVEIYDRDLDKVIKTYYPEEL